MEMSSATPEILARFPAGTLVHRDDGDGYGPSGCPRCGWRGVPTLDRDLANMCPACEIGPDVDGEFLVAWMKRRPLRSRALTATKVARNAPCPCGSGKKHKKCCA